jgi:uncharacterized protein YbaR (Trm112 family)
MKIDEALICPKCNGTHFKVKREATYLYTYKLDTPVNESGPIEANALPFLFDYREQLGNKEYLECEECHSQYPCDLEIGNPKIHLTILQKAIRSEFENNPGYLG